MTIGTRLFTWMRGELVGDDAFGNRYYHERRAPVGRRRRRWVMYKGEIEASSVPAEWDAWLHHSVDAPPSASTSAPHPWQKPHVPNLTGTAQAYRPPGDIAGGARGRRVPPPYEAWRP